MLQVLADTLTKVPEYFFAYSCVTERLKKYPSKNLHLFSGRGFSIKNIISRESRTVTP